MKASNLFDNKCKQETDYLALILMCFFFITGYLLFKRKPNLVSPVINRKIIEDKNQRNKKLIEENQEDFQFFLDNDDQ